MNQKSVWANTHTPAFTQTHIRKSLLPRQPRPPQSRTSGWCDGEEMVQCLWEIVNWHHCDFDCCPNLPWTPPWSTAPVRPLSPLLPPSHPPTPPSLMSPLHAHTHAHTECCTKGGRTAAWLQLHKHNFWQYDYTLEPTASFFPIFHRESPYSHFCLHVASFIADWMDGLVC